MMTVLSKRKQQAPPQRASVAIVKAVDPSQPPLRLLLSKAAVSEAEKKLDMKESRVEGCQYFC